MANGQLRTECKSWELDSYVSELLQMAVPIEEIAIKVKSVTEQPPQPPPYWATPLVDQRDVSERMREARSKGHG